MIASPGDVETERSIAREVVYEWNSVNSEFRKIVLLPTGWESHSSPEMGASPQDIINKQVLDKADILIGVFWTRLGTPTVGYGSGTVEEIEKHISLGKTTMLYFSSQPVVLDTVDMEQITLLKRFKESCKERGLYESYENLSDFKNKVYRHLQLKMNQEPYLKNSELKYESAPSGVVIPSLSEDAKRLLKQASLDPQGTIMLIKTMGGTSLQTNRINFISSSEPRETARWEGAIDELLSKQLLVIKGTKGEVFKITNLGYQVADMIQL